MTRRAPLATFFALYFGQGVPWGLVTITLALELTRRGLGPAELGALFANATLPWTWKPFAGPLVDWLGTRPRVLKAVVIAVELAMAATLLALARLDPRRETLFVALVLVHNGFAALQDVATDGLALASVPAERRGLANGLMSAGKYVGVLVGGSALAFLTPRIGWTATAATAAALTLVPAAFVLVSPFAAFPRATREHGVRAAWRELFAAGARKALARTVVPVAFALLAGASEPLLGPLLFPLFRNQLGVSDDRMTALVTLGGAVSAVCALLGGTVADRLGVRRTIVAATLWLAASNAAFAALRPLWPSYTFLLAFTMVAAIPSGVLYSTTLALFMNLSRSRFAATQFQLYMSLINLRSTWAFAAGGLLAVRLSAPAMFLFGAVLELLALAVLPRTMATTDAPTLRDTGADRGKHEG